MGLNLLLLVHNVLSVISAILFIGLAFFTYLNGRRKTANIAMALVFLGGGIFSVSHIIGVNVTDPLLSRDFLMFNLCLFSTGVFQVQAVLALVGKDHEKRWLILFFYVTAAAFIVFFLFQPDLFLLPSVSKMYFPNYYNPGLLNWTRVVYLDFIALPYSLYLLASAYLHARSPMERNQYKYFFLTLLIAYTILFIPNFLVYNIYIDPLWGMLSSVFFIIPFLYGALKYELFNVRVIAKQAFLYSLAIAAVGGLITLLNYANTWLTAAYPSFPAWTIALVSAFMAVTISVIVWRSLRQSDVLKYEFITTVTHKFLTPLTHIRWAAENLSKSPLSADDREQVGYILGSDAKLVELTDLLANVSNSESGSYNYRLIRTDLSALTAEVITALENQAGLKQLGVAKDLPAGMFVLCDAERIKFVLQTLFENAINYTPKKGSISISIKKTYKGRDIVLSVTDSGIGISKEDLPMLFSKFYRGREARSTDTEGLGIGLYVAREIAERHHGSIWSESGGPGKGATFSFSLPAVS